MDTAISTRGLTKRYGEVAALRGTAWAGEVTRERDSVRVVARDTAAANREILPLIAAQGVALARFERVRPSLEDIFLRLVGAPGTSEKATVA